MPKTGALPSKGHLKLLQANNNLAIALIPYNHFHIKLDPLTRHLPQRHFPNLERQTLPDPLNKTLLRISTFSQ